MWETRINSNYQVNRILFYWENFILSNMAWLELYLPKHYLNLNQFPNNIHKRIYNYYKSHIPLYYNTFAYKQWFKDNLSWHRFFSRMPDIFLGNFPLYKDKKKRKIHFYHNLYSLYWHLDNIPQALLAVIKYEVKQKWKGKRLFFTNLLIWPSRNKLGFSFFVYTRR